MSISCKYLTTKELYTFSEVLDSLKPMEETTMTIDNRLRKILAKLRAVATDLEAQGFNAQSDELDAASEKIDDIAMAFEVLAGKW